MLEIKYVMNNMLWECNFSDGTVKRGVFTDMKPLYEQYRDQVVTFDLSPAQPDDLQQFYDDWKAYERSLGHRTSVQHFYNYEYCRKLREQQSK